MNCKTDKIRTAWAAGDRIGALRIAARFFDRSADTKAFKRGMDARNNPNFFRQLGKDPEQIVGNALEALARRFSLHFHPSQTVTTVCRHVVGVYMPVFVTGSATTGQGLEPHCRSRQARHGALHA
jgi:hypothetical protein